jgi:hypothetical protein
MAVRLIRRYRYLFAGFGMLLVMPLVPVKAAEPGVELVTPQIIENIRSFIDQDIVRLSILNQNEKYNNFKEEDILRLDAQWVEETRSESQPLISATLSNPVSAYLTRIQAHSAGLYTEIFVMDQYGLNVGQSNISSDYWQGDEAKFQKTYPVGGNAIFIDEPEYNDERMIWVSQVNLSIADGTSTEAIGAVTVEINLTELQRRHNLKPASKAISIVPAAPIEAPVMPAEAEAPVNETQE